MAPVAGPQPRGPSRTPHFGTQQGSQPHPSPVTAVWNSGFENQVASYVVDGAGLCDAVVGTPGVATDQAHSGAASLKIVQAAAAQYIAINVNSTVLVMRFYFRLLAAPTGGDLNLLEGHFTSGGSKAFLSVLNGTTTMIAGNDTVFAASGATLNTGQWYRVDVCFDATTTPNVFQWMLDGVAQTSLTTAQSVQTYTSVNFGNRFAATATCWYDDAIISQTASDYPIGPGYSKIFVPNGKGTHVPGAGAFQDDTAAAITDASDAAGQSWLRLDEQPPNATDFITQTAADTNGYLEYALTDSAEGNPPNSVAVYFAAHAASAASCDISVKTNDNGTITAGSTKTTALTSEVYSREVLARRPSTGLAWTEDALSSLLLRAGYAADATPNPRIDAVWVEVDYAGVAPTGVVNQTVNAPAATASASGPTPTVQLQVAPAAATASASAPTPTLQLRVAPAAATATASAPTPTVQLQVAPAAATATASAPTPAIQLQVAPAAATASASAPTPTVQLQVAPAAATATASAPGPVMPIVVPVATASANSPPATPQLQLTPAAATASASAPLPTPKLQVSPAAATATASAPLPSVDIKVSPAAATASASAPTPTLKEQVAPGADTATGSAPTPGVDVKVSPASATASASAPIPTVTTVAGNQTVSAPAATATASAPTPTPALKVSPAAATASASAPTPTISVALTAAAPVATASATGTAPTLALRLSPPAATASASAIGPADIDAIPAPAATAAASAPAPTLSLPVGGFVIVPLVTAVASAPTPKIHHIFLDIAELWHHHENGLGEFPIAPGLSLNTSELFNQRYRDNSKAFPVTGDPTLTVDLEKLWDQKYRDTSVLFPVDQL